MAWRMLPSPELRTSLYSSVKEPEFWSAPRMPCDLQSRITESRTVMLWPSLKIQLLLPPVTSKPSKTMWLACWNLIVLVPPLSRGRVLPLPRRQRMMTGLAWVPLSSSPTMMLPL